MATKFCKACMQDVPHSDYYFAFNNILTTLCKKCHNKKKCIHQKANPKASIKIPTGFAKLNKITRIAILKDIDDGMKYKPIANKHKIGYSSLLRWKTKGLLIL
jgi:hypothetical protein